MKAVSLGVLASAAILTGNAQAMQQCDLHFSNGVTLFAVPVASTLAEQEQGLSKTRHIGPGMLFLWQEPATRTFWMRNTWVPLDIGFFDEHGDLFQIEPMAANSDTRHKSERPAQFALELLAGQYATLGLVPGANFKLFGCVTAGTEK